MGQAPSIGAPPPTLEQLSSSLTRRFAQNCYTPLELYCFNSVFKSLADSQSGIRYWSESTLCRFLELPDTLEVGPTIFHMSSYLGAFPFPSQAPAILTNEALLKVVTLMTGRYRKVLSKKRKNLWIAEIYRSLAVYDRGLVPNQEKHANSKGNQSISVHDSSVTPGKGFEIDEASAENDGEYDSDDEDDDLVLEAFELMDATELFKYGERSNIQHSLIPCDNFLKLLYLLLLTAPLDPQESLSELGAELSKDRLRALRDTASNILNSFSVENTPGITFKIFNIVVSSCLPYVFDGLNPLFEHFLFAKDLDLSKRQPSSRQDVEKVTKLPQLTDIPRKEPILEQRGDLLNMDTLCQLSFFLKGSSLFRRIRPLYSANSAGFSMGSFEKSVLNWRAPSILLVSGTLIQGEPESSRERTFVESLPSTKLLDSTKQTASINTSGSVVYGAYIPVPWKQTPKNCFGDSNSTLFQLSPVHDVFAGSNISSDYTYFSRSPTRPSGVGFGSSVSKQGSHGLDSKPLSLGPVSLHMDDALEFAVFTHLSSGGGSYMPSKLPSRRGKDWQDRFEIELLEVWGCGGDEDAEAQRKQWAWEEREAEMRRRVNLGTGDIDADRELLKIAGIISERSGGSV